MTRPPALTSGERLEIALRVLAVSTVHGIEPPPAEIAALRALAGDDREAFMPIDDLARAIIMRECRELSVNDETAAAKFESLRLLRLR